MTKRITAFHAINFTLGTATIAGTSISETVVSFVGLGETEEHIQLAHGLAQKLATDLLSKPQSAEAPSPKKAQNSDD